MPGIQKELMTQNPDDSQIKERLKNYLKKDDTGVRKAILHQFLTGESYTTRDIHSFLESEYAINYRSVSAMVGLMNTKLGILSVDVSRKHNVYYLKDCYRDPLEDVLGNY